MLPAGRLKKLYNYLPHPPDTSLIGPARRDILNDDLYYHKGIRMVDLFQASRGCRFACNFCAVSTFFDKTHYCRNVREVVAEIEAAERQILFFVDDNILSNFEAAKALFRVLIPLKVHWVSQGSLDMTQDLELMELMVKSGCLGLVVGFESITPQSLRSMKKSPNVSGGFKRYGSQLKIMRDYGLQLWAAFTLGHDYDTRESIEQTLEFSWENKFPLAAFNILVPYPGTPLYRQLAADRSLLALPVDLQQPWLTCPAGI